MREARYTVPGQEFGPWEAIAGTGVRTQFVRGDDTRPGFVVADLGASPLARRDDIARLIAAAPDLYDGCNAALGLIQLVLGRNDLSPALREVLTTNHRIDEARVAVAKARGEA